MITKIMKMMIIIWKIEVIQPYCNLYLQKVKKKVKKESKIHINYQKKKKMKK